jgi:hypothetical protein
MSDLPPTCPNCAWAIKVAEERQLKMAPGWILVHIAEWVDRRTLQYSSTISDLAIRVRLSRRCVQMALKTMPTDLLTMRFEGGVCIFTIGRGAQNMHTPAQDMHTPPAQNMRSPRAKYAQPYIDSPKSPLKEERTELRSDAPASPARAQEPDEGFDLRKQVFTQGRSIVQRRTGRLNGQAGSLLGRFLKEAHGDAAIVLTVLQAADADPPGDFVSWVVAAIQQRVGRRGGKSVYDTIRDKIGMKSCLVFPDDDEPDDDDQHPPFALLEGAAS